MKILYVDDQPDRARQIEQLLQSFDMQIVHAASSTRAASFLKRNRPDVHVILLNLNLGSEQGLNALAYILEQDPDLPVVALCDPLDHDLARQAIRAGARDVLPGYILNPDLLQLVIHYAVERKQVEESLRRRDEILKAISIIANRLLNIGNLEEVFTEALALLGKATHASRVNIFVHHPAQNGDDLGFSLRYEWDAPGIPNLLSGGLFENRSASGTLIDKWWHSLRANQIVHARYSEYPPEAWAILPEGTLSILIAPIIIRNSVWGTIEFNDCAVERVWSVSEIEALQTAASLLAAGIQHHEMLESYRALVDHSLQELLIFQDNRVIYANPAAVASIAPLEHLRQLFPEELALFIHPEDRSMLLQSLDGWEQWTTPVRRELRLLKPDGSIRWVECLATRITYQDRPALQVALLDLTERKEFEEALQRGAESLKTIFEHLPGVVARYDRNLRYQYVNRAIEELLSIPAEQFIGKTQRELGFSEEMVEQWESALRRVLERGEEVVLEFEQNTARGRASCEAHLMPEFSSDGSVESVLAVSMDVTERKRVQRELEKALDELQMIASSISDVLWVGEFDSQGNYHITYVSPVMEKLTGHPSEFFLRDPGNWLSVVHPEDRQKVIEMDRRAYQSNLEEIEGEYRLIDASGRMHWVRDNIRIIRLPDGVVRFVGVVSDITERKAVEQDLQEANQQLMKTVSELEERSREAVLFNEMGDLLQNCISMEEIYHVVSMSCPRLFSVLGGALYIIDRRQNFAEAVANWGEMRSLQVFEIDSCWALRRGRPHIVEQTENELICRHVTLPFPPSYLCVPLIAQGETIGLLHLQCHEGQMASRCQQVANMVAERVALAISNLRLRETLRMQSIRDPLTNLYNRRYMDETMHRELSRASRRGHSIGIIMMDIDHFKVFNDSYGHEAGDVILQTLGAYLLMNVRNEDSVCRYGGEEFIIIMPECTLEETVQRANELRKGAEALTISYRGTLLGGLTLSGGVAAYPRNGATFTELLQACDRALYRAKQMGRNQIAVAE